MSQRRSLPSSWPIPFFAYGAAFYPEYLMRETWLRQLDKLVEAKCNILRLVDSAWGILEPAKGEYRFDLLIQWIDDCVARGISCLVGTGSYIAPQWLFSSHPGITPEPAPGVTADSIGRRNACINQPAFREAANRYAAALAAAVGRHPGVVGWQLDNEIDALLHASCYCPACRKEWTSWLERRFGSIQRLNDELGLHYWGFQVSRLTEVRLPVVTGAYNGHPVIKLTERLFRRDCILDFLNEQATVLRESGVRSWMLHDFTGRADLSSQTLTEEDIFDLRANNLYVENVAVEGAVEPSVITADAAAFWAALAWGCEHLRSIHGQDAYLCTETSCGTIGGTVLPRKYTAAERQRFSLLFLVAHGGNGILYWSGNAWHGGPWPLWRSMFDYENEPEADFDRFVEMGALFARWGETLRAHPPQAEAAFVHDYENKLYADCYPVHPLRVNRPALLSAPASAPVAAPRDFPLAATEPLRQLGWGLSGLPPRRLCNAAKLAGFKLITLIGNACLDDPRYAEGLRGYVEQGGTLVIGPLVNFQEKGGVFRRQGLGGNFESLCGARVRSFRRFGTIDATAKAQAHLRWDDSEGLMTGESAIVGGLFEVLKVKEEAQIIGRLTSADPSVDGAPAAIRRRLGKGTVYRFAAWPEDWDRLVPHLAQPAVRFLNAPLPAGVQAVPRTDGSLFVLNGLPVPAEVSLCLGLRDRLSDQPVAAKQILSPYGVLWLERRTPAL